jgi:hypothetical protein
MVALRGAAAGVGSLKFVLGVLMVDFSDSVVVGLGTFGAGGFVGFHMGINPFGYYFGGDPFSRRHLNCQTLSRLYATREAELARVCELHYAAAPPNAAPTAM